MSNTANSPKISSADMDAVKVRPFRILSMTAVALVLNLLAMWIGSAAGATLETFAPEPINAITVAVTTAVPLLLAGAVLWFLTLRFPLRRLAAWVGLVFALVSSAGSFMAAAEATTAFTLATMHYITGMAWFVALMPWVKTARS